MAQGTLWAEVSINPASWPLASAGPGCRWCGGELFRKRRGRPPIFCSHGCRQRQSEASRERRTLSLVELARRDGFICGEAVGRREASVDHIIPVARGGTSDADNLQLAHFKCNQRKGYR